METISLFIQPRPSLSRTIERFIATGEVKSRAVEMARGSFLFREGDDIRTTFYLERGLVRLYSETPDGHSKTVFFHKAGTLMGFQGFQKTEDRKPSILNAVATTNIEARIIDSAGFRTYLMEHGEVCYEMAQYLFDMMSLQTREAVNASVYPVLQRFAALLLTLAQECSSAHAPAIVPFNSEELASMLGVHVNSITNAATSLRKAGCVERQRGALVIIDFKKLKAVAEDLIVENRRR